MFQNFLGKPNTLPQIQCCDCGLLVGKNDPPILGEYAGINIKVMEELGYTVMKKDTDGKPLIVIDCDATRAIQNRSNYIYINLKDRDENGIVDPKA